MNIFNLARFITEHPLNRAAPWAALGRLARWQLASRLIAAPVALPFVNETRLLCERGMTGATGNWYCGLHEVADMALLLHLLRPDDEFFDIGANVGSYTVLAAGAVGARVIAVEPIPESFARLQSNIRLNDLAVTALCCGISDSSGEMRFITDADTMNRIALAEEQTNTIMVPVRTLDSLPGQPRLIKIDVEGHEMAVLNGGHRQLASPDLVAVIMEINDSAAKFGVRGEALIAMLEGYGFKACTYDPFRRELGPRIGDTDNTLFVRDADAVNACCQSAPQYRLCNGFI